MNLSQYIESVNQHYQSGHATEHTYRGDFAELIRGLVQGIHITNEPSNVTDCGNPDYVITRKDIPIGFIEAKDVGKDLNSQQYADQFSRYRKALDNLIITDYINFQFFKNGKKEHEIIELIFSQEYLSAEGAIESLTASHKCDNYTIHHLESTLRAYKDRLFRPLAENLRK